MNYQRTDIRFEETQGTSFEKFPQEEKGFSCGFLQQSFPCSQYNDYSSQFACVCCAPSFQYGQQHSGGADLGLLQSELYRGPNLFPVTPSPHFFSDPQQPLVFEPGFIQQPMK